MGVANLGTGEVMAVGDSRRPLIQGRDTVAESAMLEDRELDISRLLGDMFCIRGGHIFLFEFFSFWVRRLDFENERWSWKLRCTEEGRYGIPEEGQRGDVQLYIEEGYSFI